MPDIHWDAILLLLVVDLLLVLAFSVWAGYVVARAADRSRTQAILIALFLPVVGPAFVGIRHAKESSPSRRLHERPVTYWLAVGMLVLSAVALVVATLMPWGQVEGRLDGRAGSYGGTWDASPWDTKVGALATVGSAAIIALWVGVLVWTARRRTVALVAGSLGLLWLLVAVDSWMVVSLVPDIDGLSVKGEQVDASLAVGPAVWLTLVAGALIVSAGALLTVRAVETPTTVPVAAATPGSAWDHGYGDGF